MYAKSPMYARSQKEMKKKTQNRLYVELPENLFAITLSAKTMSKFIERKADSRSAQS